MSLSRTLCLLKCFMTSIRRQSSERTDFLFCQNSTPVTVVCHCIRRQCFILLPNGWVVFKIYFAILHKIVARNNVQQSIRLNKQKGKKKITLWHYFGQPCYTSGSFAFSTWPHGRDVLICERCVVIFLKTVTFIGDLVKSSGYTMIFMLVYAESFKSIRMLAYRVNFCCCRSKVCSDAFVNLFSQSFLQHGCMLKL